jgi:hypothetical protein
MDPLTLSLFAKPVTQLAAKLLQPLVSKLEKEVSVQAQLAYHRFVNTYTEYLKNSAVRHSYFNSVVFKNEQRKLLDYYQPLTLIQGRTEDKIVADHYPKTIIDEIQNILIVDTAGMGKTTLLKFLFLNCITQEAGIPVFVELRKLSKKQSLLKFVLEQLSDIEGGISKDLFFKILSSGDFVFFLDGYDEIPENERSTVTSSIQQFMEKTPGNKFIMTSRDEAGLAAFSQFQRYTIQPLKQNEAFSLLKKYSGESELATKLIEKLQQPENYAIHEFLTNPLLTSLLFKSFEFKHAIPLKKHIFYRQVYESLYETHDLTKEGGAFQRAKRCGLDIDKFAKILKCLGAVTYKAEKVEFSKEEALSFIAMAKTLAVEQKSVTSDILHDLTHTVPLLVQDGNYIRWSHRSIQEYFAAQYICESAPEKRIEILLKHVNDRDFSKHVNLLLLCADMDKPSFDQSIGSKIAEELLIEYRNSYQELNGLIEENELSRRKKAVTGKHAFYIKNAAGDIFSLKERPQEYSRSIHDRMAKSCNNKLVSSTMSHSSPSIAFAFEKIGRIIDDLKLSKNVPFIIAAEKVRKEQIDIFDGSVDFLKITDDVENLSNSLSKFSAITEMVEYFSDWKFDPEIAIDYLSRVQNDISEKRVLEPW